MPYDVGAVTMALRHRPGFFRRICLQVVNYPGFLQDSFAFLEALGRSTPLSVSVMPLGKRNYERLRDHGADSITIPMDAATPELFQRHKGRGGFYRWEKHMASIREAVDVLGRGNVCTYLIVGLGETDEEALRFLCELREIGAVVALHSFTAVPGLDIEGARPPDISRYRGIQLARYLIFEKGARLGNFEFKEGRLDGVVGLPGVDAIAAGEEPYLTTGCPDCNRPFYNERVRGPLYNLPSLRVGGSP